ncbi:MAG: branched-chain amino acid ABC transporter permease [Candidatus Bathyarchaeia archaeon]
MTDININRPLLLYLVSVTLLILMILPLYGEPYMISILTSSFIYLAAAEMWSFLAGHLRLISLGQQAFLGLGMYTVLLLNEIYKWPLWASVVFSALIGASAAGLLSLSFLRLRGFYFSLATILFSEILFHSFLNWTLTGGATGLTLSIGFKISMQISYYAALIVSILSILIIYYFHNSKIGFAIRATGCDEEAAAEIGVNVFLIKASCLIVSGAITALSGAIFIIRAALVNPYSGFSFEWGLALVFISVIGGIGTIIGPIIGSVIYVVLRSILAGFIGLSMLLQGIICVVILTIAPAGVWGLISAAGKSWGKIKRPLKVLPSYVVRKFYKSRKISSI